MKCNICNNRAIIYLSYSSRFLCKRHFCHYFEKKVKRAIRKFGLMEGKRIGVAVSGGKDSLTILYILNKIAEEAREKDKLVGIIIDEGIKGYRDRLIEDTKKFCKKINVELKVYSFKKEFGISMDEIIKIKKRETSCTYCGVFRRWILNKVCRELGIDRLVIGHNLDDMVQSFLMNIIRNEPFRLVRFGEFSGIIDDERFVKRVRPLMEIPEREVAVYAILNNIKKDFFGCPYVEESFRHTIRNFINDLEEKYPGTKFKLFNSYIKIKEALSKEYEIKKNEGINYCKICNEPTSKEICRACELLKSLKKEKR